MAFSAETHPVTDYQDPSDKVEAALRYPGARPEASFMTDGETVTPLPDTFAEFKQAADKMLVAQGLPTIDQRYPVLAYGANASPARLRAKMKKFDPDMRSDMQMVPNIMATVPDAAAVWHGRQGQGGSVFAELYQGPEVEGVNLQAHVAFVTKEQLATFHTTEGATYAVAEIPVIFGTGDAAEHGKVNAYVALRSQIALEDDKPILVENLNHTGATLLHKTVEQMAEKMLRQAGSDTDVRDYIAETLPKPLAEKKKLQAAIGNVLIEQGHARTFVFTNPESGILIGRTDFTSLPGGQDKHLLQIPEMALQAIRPDPAGLAERMEKLAIKYPDRTYAERLILIDPARKISVQAHDELAVRLETADNKA